MHKDAPNRISRFTDIHCHCLPGVDDGPRDNQEALELCRALVHDGVQTVVATCHQMGYFQDFAPAPVIREKTKKLNDLLKDHGIPLTVLPGAEVHIDERISQLLEDGQLMTIADQNTHLLLELPFDHFIDAGLVIPMLAGYGLTTIIAHPERNSFLAQQPDYVMRWKQQKPIFQITSGSLLGIYGKRVQKAAWKFLELPVPCFIASDAHDTENRYPCMTQAVELVAKHLPPDRLHSLIYQTPESVVSVTV